VNELYDLVQRVNAEVDRRGLDAFRVRGEIALKVGYLISLVDEQTPSEPDKVEQLRLVAKEVLGVDL